MKKEVLPPAVFVKDTGTAKGRGVFAARAYSCGEIVEECPVIVVKIVFPFLPNEMKTIVFNWASKDEPNQFAIALGYGSLYNHDNPANMRTKNDKENLLLRFIAQRDIQEGEELTHNYNSNPDEPDCNDWFERNKITPIVSSPV